jgi:exodeoxyribonuclease V beta subunit
LILAATETPQFEMRLDMLQQAMSALSRAGHGDNRDLLGLIDFIRSRRQDQSTETEPMSAPMHGSRVQIMTIHASKGLEFPVVFLAGGFTRWNKPITVAEYRDKARHKVFHFRPEREALQAVASEEKAEYRRLFYVAMTRAIFKLYVPLVSMPAKGRGSAGPVATVLLPALKRGCPDKGDMEVAQIIPLPVRVSRVRSIAAPNEGPAPLVALRSISGPLFPELAGGLDKRRLVVKSFSSMARQHVAPVGEGPSYGEPEAVVVDEVPTAVETEDPLRGPVFGDIVHKVLEAIDFAEVGRADAPGDLSFAGAPARQVIDRLVHLNRAKLRSRGEEDVETAARGQVAQLVWNALRTPLSQAGGPLWQLPPADRIHELEFEYPAEAGDAVLPACREESFIVGFMDLVFRRDGRYFLVDFKTNLLPGYTQEHLERCMADSDYHRQYELYLEALERWLKGMPGRAPRFGGVYYLFLRGMNGVDDTSGVFFQSQRTVKRAFRASGRRK